MNVSISESSIFSFQDRRTVEYIGGATCRFNLGIEYLLFSRWIRISLARVFSSVSISESSIFSFQVFHQIDVTTLLIVSISESSIFSFQDNKETINGLLNFVSISESSIFSFQVGFGLGTVAGDIAGFNLGIEYLLFSRTHVRGFCVARRHGFNLGIEYLLFSRNGRALRNE